MPQGVFVSQGILEKTKALEGLVVKRRPIRRRILGFSFIMVDVEIS